MKVALLHNGTHWQALIEALDRTGWEVELVNANTDSIPECDWLLAWGAFGSNADILARTHKGKKALLIGGTAQPPNRPTDYDCIFYETPWYEDQIIHPNKHHAFGIDDEVFRPIEVRKHYEYISIGAFAYWKRYELLPETMYGLVIGEVQIHNLRESMEIITNILQKGYLVSDSKTPELLSTLLNRSLHCYIPAHLDGGGERAVMEARACGVPVHIEDDNPKLQSLLDCEVWGIDYFSNALKTALENS